MIKDEYEAEQNRILSFSILHWNLYLLLSLKHGDQLSLSLGPNVI